MVKEKAKGVVTKVDKKTKKDGSGSFYIVTIGGVEMLFFDSKIEGMIDQEVEVEYSISSNGKFIGSFSGASRPSGGGAPPRRGSSPEELKLKAIDMKLRTKTMIFSYAKDIATSIHGHDPVQKDVFWITMDYFITRMLEKCANNIKELEG